MASFILCMRPKDTDGKANSVYPDHTAQSLIWVYGSLVWVYSVCQDPSVRKLRNIKVPTLPIGRTRKAPPPAASVIIATYFGLTEQNVDSNELFVIRMLS